MLYLIIFLSLLMASTIFIEEWRGLAIFFLVVFYFLIDYANHLFSLDDSTLGTLSKSYKELVLGAALLYLLARSGQGKPIERKYIIVVLGALGLLAYGIGLNGFVPAALDWRDSAVPIVLAYTLVASGAVDEKLASRITNFFCALVAANSVLAVFQYLTFDGDFEHVWRYQFLVEQNQKKDPNYHERFAAYQVVRGGELRSSGVFASALHYSYAAALAAFHYYVKAATTPVNGPRRWPVGFGYMPFLVCTAGVYVSQVRASIVILLFSILVYRLCYSSSSVRTFRTRRAFHIFVGSLACYFVTLFALSNYLDTSIRARITQYALVIREFPPLGDGVGSHRGNFDSYYAYGVMTYGVFFIAWTIYAIRRFQRLDTTQLLAIGTAAEINFKIVALCSFYPALLIAMFQHFSGSLYYQMIWLLFSVCVFARPAAKAAAVGGSTRPHQIWLPSH